MGSQKNHPGVYVPPPLIYAAIFIIAVWIQKFYPVNAAIFKTTWIKIPGAVIILVAVIFFLFRSLRQFFKTKNTVVTALPATSLQTTGMYSISRNPMYTGLSLVYLGVTCFIGNWWNVILFPALTMIVQEYVIRREEKYLERRFGQPYLEYKSKVRRWL